MLNLIYFYGLVQALYLPHILNAASFITKISKKKPEYNFSSIKILNTLPKKIVLVKSYFLNFKINELQKNYHIWFCRSYVAIAGL